MKRKSIKLQKSICLVLLVILGLLMTACSGNSDGTEVEESSTVEKEEMAEPKGIFDDINVGTFEVTSEDLHDGVWDSIISNTDKGSNVSPQLSWEPVEGAACYVIYMTDADAYNWVHWKSKNVTETNIPQDWAPGKEYIGPCPPGGTHTYEIHVIALKEPVESVRGVLNLDNPKFKEGLLELDEATEGKKGNIIAYGHISGTYTKGE